MEPARPAAVVTYFIDAEVPLLSQHLEYPATLCQLEYLDEGGANIIFRVSIINEGLAPARLNRKLLRLRKDKQHSQPALDQLNAFNENFRDLFPKEHLVEHELVRLDDGIITALNDLLRNRARPSHRANDFLCLDEKYGMLITDMTPELGDNLVQLKPKWLLQSPNAPRNAVRCRTCALRAQRKTRMAATATDEQENCPLMLVSSSPNDRRKAAQKSTNDQQIAQYLSEDLQSLLLSLKEQQQNLDAQGVLTVISADGISNLCRAMTLRDCTLYIKRTGTSIEARLGDLDLKHPEKLTNWRNVEHTLIEEGWYTNTEEASARERICFLSR